MPGLDDMLSPARIRAIARSRQIERYGHVVDPHLLDQALSPERAHVWQGDQAARTKRVDDLDPFATAVLHARRTGNALELHLAGPPRTKKNHGGNFGKRNPAWLKWRADVVPSIGLLTATLELPLPAIAYNCAAVFCVDKRGELADYSGLNQGLHDVLQDAGVLVDDWWIRTCDGTRIVFGDAPPRVELALTPLSTPTDSPPPANATA